MTEFESSDMETETDQDSGLEGETRGENEETLANADSAKRSKCQFTLGPTS